MDSIFYSSSIIRNRQYSESKKGSLLWNVLLVVLIIFHLLVNCIWLFINKAPPTWDAASHTAISFSILERMHSGHLFDILSVSNYYPILVHTITASLLLFTGAHIKIAQAVGTLFYLIGILFLYLYTAELTKSHRAAFFTSVIFSFFPIVFDQSRRLLLDIPTTTFVMICMYFLEKSKQFRQSKYILLFFLSIGLLMMTKWTGIIFLMVPLFLTFLSLIKTKTIEIKQLLLGLFLTASIVLPWYVTNFTSVLSQSKIYVNGYVDQPSNLFSIENFVYYLRLFINLQVTPIIALFALFSFCYIFISQKKQYWHILAMIGFAYLFFSFIPNKDPRYTMPILPFSALIIAIFIENILIRYKNVSKVITLILITYMGLYFLILTIRPILLENKHISFQLQPIGWINIIDVSNILAAKYDTSTWPINTVFNDINESTKTVNSTILVDVEDEYFNPSTLKVVYQHLKLQERLPPMTVVTPDIIDLHTLYKSDVFPNQLALYDYVSSADYILLSPRYLGIRYLRNQKALQQLQTYILSGMFPSCNIHSITPAPSNTECYVKVGEVLRTTSDIFVNGELNKLGEKMIQGPARINCPWGCSFIQISQSQLIMYPQLTFVKQYLLPDKVLIMLYRIDH